MTQMPPGFGSDDLRALGQRLRQLREQRQWSLKRLAQESSVSVAAIRKIELGQSNPSLLTILSLVEALGESIDRLVSSARGGDVRISLTRGPGRGAARAGADDRTRDLTEPAMQCAVVSLKAGEALENGREGDPAFGYVLDGTLAVADDDGQTDRCGAGDAFHVSSLARFPAKSTGGKDTRLILVTDIAKREPDLEGTTDQHD